MHPIDPRGPNDFGKDFGKRAPGVCDSLPRLEGKMRRLGSHIRNQWAGFLSLFLVLTGGVAYAANTIGSTDIIDESILSRDVKNGQVGTLDLAANAVRSGKVLDESLTGHDIQDDTIGGADVNESLLDGVAYSPVFATHDPPNFPLPADGSYAQVIYTGDGYHGDPLVHVPVPGIVMASASLNLRAGDWDALVTCELGLV